MTSEIRTVQVVLNSNGADMLVVRLHPRGEGSTMTRMAACRDIDPTRLQAMLPGAELPPVYPGSIAGACQTCDVPVWVGPRIQQAIAVLGDVEVLCFPCAAQADPTGLVNLGNPYQPR